MDHAHGSIENENDRVPNGLTEKEEQELKQTFELFDKNKDGRISSEELGCVLRTLGHSCSKQEIEDMIRNVDSNENGYVEFDEFLTMMRRAKANILVDHDLSKDPKDAEKREAFRVFDMDGNGYIDKHELRYVMRRLGENLSDDDIKAMFKEADLNGDGLIDYDEFSTLMKHFGS
ncbi:hypothetical protein CHS0354_007065 [Potamilus streckersoni]|uniref:EF-hand domain-containing protein n=1 Tax=Potamilus streckersoni TaxID=2493646 RepID=A0AAE0RYI4_9BIVA|nr:hypothetical protein CHS0354_007065 [Potamilus streckersoni]